MTAVFIILLFSLSIIPFAQADWTMYRSNPSHDGQGIGKLTSVPTQTWKTTVYGAVIGSPVVVNGVLYVGSDLGNVHALDASTGAEIRYFRSEGSVDSSPTVVNGVVYFYSDDSHLYALASDNGNLLWNYTEPKGYEASSSPAVVAGVVYLNTGANLYALNANNGHQLWNFTTGNSWSGGADFSPAVTGNIVYAPMNDGNIYSLNAANGVKLWSSAENIFQRKYGEGDLISPTIVDGIVFACSKLGFVYGFVTNQYSSSISPPSTASPTPIMPTPTSTAPNTGATPTPSSASSQNPIASPSPTIPEFPEQLIGTTIVVAMIIVLSSIFIAKKRTELT